METLELVPIVLEDGTRAFAALASFPAEHKTLFTLSASPEAVVQTNSPPQTGGTSSSSISTPTSPLTIDLGSDDSKDSGVTEKKRRKPRTVGSNTHFQCSICGRVSKSVGAMTVHKRTHSDERPFVCDYQNCNKAFKTSTDFARHARTHTGERPYTCQFEGCDLSFKTSSQRTVHSRQHTSERPYACPVEGCGRAFASASNFQEHSRVHSGDRPFVCPFEGCEKTYADYSSFHKHRATHDPLKRHRCATCGKTYGQISTLRQHERSKHGVTDRRRHDGRRDDVVKSGNAAFDDVLKGNETTDVSEKPDSDVTNDQKPRVSVVRVDQTPVSNLSCLTRVVL